MPEMTLFEAMYTARAIRRLRPDPVPDDVITKVLDAAIRAPSGSNAQSWLFVVAKDPSVKKRLGDIYKKASSILVKLYSGRERPAHMEERQYERFMASVTHLFDHMGDAPVIIVPCLRSSIWTGAASLPDDIKRRMQGSVRLAGSSIYPAVQNIILACRAHGLGTVLTTIHAFFEEEVHEILGLPDDVQTYAMMPIGYPQGHFGPVKRRPVGEVACLDRYGNPWKA
jgi:nitroreductase